MLDISPIGRSKTLIREIAIENAVLDLENNIDSKIRTNLDNEQKEYFLKEKLKIIKDELGDSSNREDDIVSLKDRVNNVNLPIRIKNKLLKEIHRLDSTSEMSPDSSVIRNYIEYLLDIPWGKITKDEKDLMKIEKKLNASHYSFKSAKDRIIEYIAVKSISEDVNTPIICLVGPPGVGKTTFASSIANALNRNFVKISLGGMSDSSDLVGHRRAYIGSSPGRIISSLIKCGSMNPVFLLDEVDKLKKDYKGDPASTLLDILDVSQNTKFIDNYIDEEVDLSQVLFILTANDISSIPSALLDRLEIINLSGYSFNEKKYICEKRGEN
jgi:ATP-dependent Lon protease